MSIGVVGRKLGMTRIFTDAGGSIPVTVIEVAANRVAQVKDAVSDGYRAIQVTTGKRRPSRVKKPVAGHFAKAGVEPGRGLWEFRLEDQEGEAPEVGGELGADVFEVGQKVDVSGTTKGKGFAGTVKRHNFSAQRNTHGNSKSHRVPGSIGQCQTPGRVLKNKRMAGQMGSRRRTTEGLEVVRVDAERNLLLVRGSVPGATGSDLMIRPSVRTGR